MVFQCEGWWEQDYFGRQTMSSLTLTFQDGAIEGTGQDIVGPFTMTGVLKEGKVAIDKQYVGQHAAKYLGDFDGEGSIQGTWHISGMTGPWAIHMRRVDSAPCVQEIKPNDETS